MTTSTRERAIALRMEGYSCRDIAHQLGVSRQRVSLLVGGLKPIYLAPEAYARLQDQADEQGLTLAAYLARL